MTVIPYRDSQNSTSCITPSESTTSLRDALQVAAGLADATWTLSPKHEWDVAAGVALVQSAGGRVACIRDGKLQFNQPNTLLPGLIAGSSANWQTILRTVEEALVS